MKIKSFWAALAGFNAANAIDAAIDGHAGLVLWCATLVLLALWSGREEKEEYL